MVNESKEQITRSGFGVEAAGWLVIFLLLLQSALVRVQAQAKADVDLGSFSGRALVLIFVSVDCPISNSYAPEFRRLKEKFEKQGFVFRLVYPNPDESEEAIQKQMKDYRLDFVSIRDLKHEWVRRSGVHVTPEAAVYVPKRGWVYHGRINDRYAALGRARSEAQQHDLRDVLTKIVDGMAFEPFSTKAVGCYIEGAK